MVAPPTAEGKPSWSEALGLKWDSVDFDRKTVTIKHTVSKVTQAVEKDTTKTASSYRSFPLLPEAEAIFRREREAKAENRRLFGKGYHPSDYIFTWPDGRLLSPDADSLSGSGAVPGGTVETVGPRGTAPARQRC